MKRTQNFVILIGIPVFGCLSTFFTVYVSMYFDNVSSSFNIFIIIYLAFSTVKIVVICWLWFAWAYQKLEESLPVSLSPADKVMFAFTGIIRILVWFILIRLIRLGLSFFITAPYSQIGIVLAFAFFLGLILLFLLKVLYGYQPRIKQVLACLLGTCGGLFLKNIEYNFQYISTLHCYIVFAIFFIASVFLFIFDIYESNINKETLWWKSQYVNFTIYKKKISNNVLPFKEFWINFYNINSMGFRWNVLWEFPLLFIITLISFVLFPLEYVGTSIVCFFVVLAVGGNITPLVSLSFLILVLTLVAFIPTFQKHITFTYGNIALKKVYWNGPETALVKYTPIVLKGFGGAITLTAGGLYFYNEMN